MMRLLQQLPKTHSNDRSPAIVPSADEADFLRERFRAMSLGTRVDLIFLSVWLIASGLAAIGILGFLLYSYLPDIAH
jgi:hypothetical protein